MTATEYLFKQINKIRLELESENINGFEFLNMQQELFEKAKEMERTQHGNTWDNAIESFEKRAFVKVRAICDFDEYEIK